MPKNQNKGVNAEKGGRLGRGTQQKKWGAGAGGNGGEGKKTKIKKKTGAMDGRKKTGGPGTQSDGGKEKNPRRDQKKKTAGKKEPDQNAK
ncbi:hypothetical protein RKK42_31255 [Klebsiella pneumoniae]|nr:hypothetical protein [Klebsiella pneumoniae]